jgi:hypothetical protein
VKLKVTDHELERGKRELYFHMYHEAVDTKKGTKGLPFHESRRRKAIKSLKAQVTILVNGFKVSSTFTKQANINFPSFEVDIGENFQIYLYTMPLSIDISLKIGGKEVARIPVEIPGERVKALTSTYSIAREIKFS